MQIQGYGGSDNSGATTFEFAPVIGATGSGVLFTDDGVTYADNSKMSDITIQSRILHPGNASAYVTDGRLPLTNYRKGDVVNYFIAQGTGATIASHTTTTMNVSGLSGMASSVGTLLYLSGAEPPNAGMSFLIVAADAGGASVDVQQLGDNTFYPDPNSGSISWFQFSPYFFRAKAAGQSASGTSVLATMAAVTKTSVDGQADIVDGGVTWTTEAFPLAWRASQSTKVGERCYTLGDPRAIYECTVAGTTDTVDYAFLGNTSPQPQSNPIWDIPGPGHYGDTFTDGTVTWKRLIHAGVILNAASIQINNVFVGGFTNHAFLVTTALFSSGSSLIADFCSISNCNIYYCGMGIGTDGGDANVLTADKISALGLGKHLQSRDVSWGDGTGVRRAASTGIGTGAHMAWDRGSGNIYRSLYVQDSYAPAYFSSGSVSHATFHDCNDEATLGNFAVNSATVFSGQGKGQRPDSLGQCLIPQLGYNIQTSSRWVTGTSTISVCPGLNQIGSSQDSWDSWQIPGVSANWLSWAHSRTSFGTSTQGTGAIGTGWSAWHMWLYTLRLMVGFSDSASVEGGGNWRLYQGQFLGMSSPYYLGYDSGAATDPGVRAGARNQGDRQESQSTGAAGQYIGSVVATSGYRGVAWNTLMIGIALHGGGGTAGADTPATIVEPSAGGSYAYTCTTAGTADTTEPVGPVVTQWTAGATITLNEIMTPSNTHWNGFAYKATAIGPSPHHTGGSEPSWRTDTTTFSDGDITWTRQVGAWGHTTGQITRDGANSSGTSGITWTWLGAVPVTNNYGLIPYPYSATTGYSVGTATDGDFTETATVLAARRIDYTQALTGDHVVTFAAPATVGGYYEKTIFNNTTGGHSLAFDCGAGANVTIANGKTATLGFMSTGVVVRCTADV